MQSNQNTTSNILKLHEKQLKAKIAPIPPQRAQPQICPQDIPETKGTQILLTKHFVEILLAMHILCVFTNGVYK